MQKIMMIRNRTQPMVLGTQPEEENAVSYSGNSTLVLLKGPLVNIHLTEDKEGTSHLPDTDNKRVGRSRGRVILRVPAISPFIDLAAS